MWRMLFLSVVVCLVCLSSGWAQIVDETTSSIILNKTSADVSLVLENPNRSFDSRINLELLDVTDQVRAKTTQNLKVKKGREVYKISIPLGDLLKEAEDEIAWFRLRYRIGEKSGIISLSELIKDIFDLRLIASNNIFAGMNYRVRVRAVHPFTNQPVKNIKIKGELTLDIDSESDDDELKLTGSGNTDTDGFVVLEFKIPPGVKLEYDGELKITGEKYGIRREIEEDVSALEANAQVFINTDKLLYQPGQTLNVRGLLMKGTFENTAVSDAQLDFSIKDEEDTLLYRQTVKTSAFGIASISWQIPENAKLGTYRINVKDEDGEEVGSETIKVSRYDLPQFVVKTKTDSSFYLPSQKTAEIEISADYLFGKSVTKGKVRLVREGKRLWNYRQQKWDIEEQKSFEGETDKDGKFIAKIDLSETHDELKSKSYRRYQDLNFAAYFTDLTTNRTEQRRFDLRVTKEAIHVYFISETYNRNPNLPLTYFVSTFYADGTPAPAIVSINGKYENEIEFKPIAQIKTNSYGAGKFEFLAPKNADIDKDLKLKFFALDSRQQTGTFEEDIDFDKGDELQVRTEKTIYKPGETVKAEIISTKKDAFVYVDLARDWSVIESRFVQLKNGRAEIKFPFQRNFKGELTIAAYTEIIDEEDELETIRASREIVFPAPQNLLLDAKFSQEVYRPNEEAKINFSVLAPDKSPIESALGIVIFDKAIEERARTDSEFGGYRRMFSRFDGLLGLESSFGGLTMKDINELSLAKPISEDMQLAAELMLAESDYHPQIYRSAEDMPQARSVFAKYLDAQLAPIEAALKNAYTKDYSRPTDEFSLRKILLENGIDFNALRDPWGVNYRAKFEIEEANDILDIQSAGADKKFDTKDDFTVLKMSFSYFLPIGKMIDKAVLDYHKATGGFIRDYETLRVELRKQNFDLDNLRDRWNRPYIIEFSVNQRKFKIVFRSNGANGEDEEYNWNSDDFEAWTSEIDYFAETGAKIQNILHKFANERKTYPKNEAEFKEILKTNNLDFEQIKDGYGQKVYLTAAIYSRFSDKVKIENTARYGENTSQKTTVEPVTQEVIAFKIRSKGEDFKEGTFDDFDLAVYSGVISEQSRIGEKTKPQVPVINSDATGAIQGVVKDITGAVIPGARITATNTDSEEEFSAETNENGEYLIENIPSGKYNVRAASSGFRDSVINNVPVRARAITQADFTLEVGAVQEVVSVSSGVVTVETASTQMGRGRGYGYGSGMGMGDGEVEKNVSENQLQNSTPRLREYFPETLVWQPELITDKKGRAELKFKLGDNITTWKLYTIASTAEGKIGIAEKEIRAFQPFFVDLEPPKVLTVGDEIALPVQIRNYNDRAQKVSVTMASANWFDFLKQSNQQIEIPAGATENAIFDFRVNNAIKEGKQRVTAIADKDSDAIEKPIHVFPNGQEIVRTHSELFRDSVSFDLDFPQNTLPNTPRAELKIYPNLLAHVAESVEGILQRPYGCGEQTISSTYPNLMILKVGKNSQLAPKLQAQAQKFLQQGYERLLGYQHASGGFSIWAKDAPDVALTAYAMRFLSDASEFIEVDEDAINRATKWLLSQQRTDGSWTRMYSWEKTEDKQRTKIFTTYVARVLAMTEKDKKEKSKDVQTSLRSAFIYLTTRNAEIDEPYALASFALALFDAGESEVAQKQVEKLRALAITEGNGAYWKLETNTPFYGWGAAGRIETTALVVQALIESERLGKGENKDQRQSSEDQNLIARGTMFLLKNKDKYGVWHSTQATINVLDALLASLSADRQIDNQARTAEIYLGGQKVKDIALPPAGTLAFPINVDVPITANANRVEIKINGNNSATQAQIVQNHYISWQDAVQADGRNTNQSRQLRLDYKCDKRDAKITEEISCQVEAERIGFRGYGMLLAEIGLPPGADVSRESLEKAKAENWNFSRYDVLPDRIIVYLWAQAGGTKFNFKFRPRYGINAQTASSVVYDYYNPEAQAILPPLKFNVK